METHTHNLLVYMSMCEVIYTKKYIFGLLYFWYRAHKTHGYFLTDKCCYKGVNIHNKLLSTTLKYLLIR